MSEQREPEGRQEKEGLLLACSVPGAVLGVERGAPVTTVQRRTKVSGRLRASALPSHCGLHRVTRGPTAGPRCLRRVPEMSWPPSAQKPKESGSSCHFLQHLELLNHCFVLQIHPQPHRHRPFPHPEHPHPPARLAPRQ